MAKRFVWILFLKQWVSLKEWSVGRYYSQSGRAFLFLSAFIGKSLTMVGAGRNELREG